LFKFKRLYKSLSTLIPPKEETSFEVYLFVEDHPDEFGKINIGPCDDFDYKIATIINEKQEVTITITRNEYDLDRLDNNLFKRKAMKAYPYDKKTFYNKTFELKKDLNELLPGFKEQDKNEILKKIGPFSFTFYFMKKTIASNDRERFFYKDINSKVRKIWLDEYGGIKVFRDGFRVRPYGEIKGNALDWLGLGIRYSASPAGIARKGDWRVREYNLSGVTNISRINNPALQDKSSREGIRDNQEFDIFKQLLISIIHTFEYDRSYIQNELKALHEEKNPKEKTAKQATKASKHAESIKKEEKDKSEAEKDREVLLQHSKNQEEEIQELLSELKILRVLASSGSMFAAFGHELHAMQNEVKDRADTLRSLFGPYLDTVDALDIPDEYNPWTYVDEIEELDKNLLHWMRFALSGIKKDKRNRRIIYLEKYFFHLQDLWSIFLNERKITLEIKGFDGDLKLNAFEVELNTVFTNLLLNSVEVFSSKKRFKERKITILNKSNENQIKIYYKDTGTGLSEDIDDRNKIFDLYYSTKRDPNTGEEVGSGIGMYLVKSIVNEYGGSVSFGEAQRGFFLIINIPKNSK